MRTEPCFSRGAEDEIMRAAVYRERDLKEYTVYSDKGFNYQELTKKASWLIVIAMAFVILYWSNKSSVFLSMGNEDKNIGKMY